MAVSSFKISDDLNIDGFSINLGTPSTGQALAYDTGTASYTPVTETPIGTVVMYVGATAPTGWVVCNGGSYATTGTYANLFAVIQYRYGGSGANFNVPDFVSKPSVGLSQTTNLTSTTSSSNSFSHSHNVGYSTADASAVSLAHTHAAGGTDAAHTHNASDGQKGNHSHGGNTPAGGAHTHLIDRTGNFSSNTGSSDSNHTHASSTNTAAHSHNDATGNANHSHSSTDGPGMSHTHAHNSITFTSQAINQANAVGVTTHGHGTISTIQLLFIIKF